MADIHEVHYNNYGYSVLVEPYCENCLEFQPECLECGPSSFDRAIVFHYIYCKHREKCARMNSQYSEYSQR